MTKCYTLVSVPTEEARGIIYRNIGPRILEGFASGKADTFERLAKKEVRRVMGIDEDVKRVHDIISFNVGNKEDIEALLKGVVPDSEINILDDILGELKFRFTLSHADGRIGMDINSQKDKLFGYVGEGYAALIESIYESVGAKVGMTAGDERGALFASLGESLLNHISKDGRELFTSAVARTLTESMVEAIGHSEVYVDEPISSNPVNDFRLLYDKALSTRELEGIEVTSMMMLINKQATEFVISTRPRCFADITSSKHRVFTEEDGAVEIIKDIVSRAKYGVPA